MTLEKRAQSEADFELLMQRLLEQHADSLSPLGAGLLAAAYTGYCTDSHTFSKRLGVEHALVIRECIVLADHHEAIEINGRNERSQRIQYVLTTGGHDLLEAAT